MVGGEDRGGRHSVSIRSSHSPEQVDGGKDIDKEDFRRNEMFCLVLAD
jgi:hypothetical protein